MNRNKLKTYAPQARREFIQAVTDRAAHYGLTAKKIEPIIEQGDVALIGGRPFPKAVGERRKKLEARIQRLGFTQTMEAMAYTWFNRLVAIRFMELHGYLEHGYRVLSHPEGHSQPEIIEHAQHVDLPGLDKQKVVALKLDGTKEEELYRMLLVGQCNALHKALPFLFEAIDDETELLLPDHLLHSDSLIRKLIEEIPEEDWQEVEIIGWLYQFYISEKKEQVIGKVVRSEDIPAATQLFTPNWIVKYLVQNSLGRQWVATYPNSPLKGQMEYYIEPAEQTPEVQAKLAEITPTSLNPEELTLLDPACGSGHILTEAYDLLKSIYQERGYRAKDIPRLILEKNLFGLEIDDRAAQLAAFALMMKARADDRGIFARGVQPHVLAIQEGKGLDAKEIAEALNQPMLKDKPPPSGELFEEIADARSPLFSKKSMGVQGAVSQADVAHLIALFEHGKTFGSLIHVPEKLAERLHEIADRVEAVIAHGGMFENAAAKMLMPLIEQAQMLARKYDAVVANPPYMGSKFFNSSQKGFIGKAYKNAKADICAAFTERGISFTEPTGLIGYVTMQSWMFLSSFESFRCRLTNDHTIRGMIHLGPHAFPEIGGQVVQVTAFVISPKRMTGYRGSYRRLTEGQSDAKERLFHTTHTYTPSNAAFAKIPGSPVAYWIADGILAAFSRGEFLEALSPTKIGMRTGENARFLRKWFEVAWGNVGIGYSDRSSARNSGRKWFPYNKGGEFRKWYGNNEHVVNWDDDGREIKEETRRKYPELGDNLGWKITNEAHYFLPSLSWSFVSSSAFGVRESKVGFLFDVGGSSTFPNDDNRKAIAAFLCSSVAFEGMKCLNPTMNFQVENVASLPLPSSIFTSLKVRATAIATEAIQISAQDWDESETSWDFKSLPVFTYKVESLQRSQDVADAKCLDRFARMKELEEDNNRLFIDAYGLQAELSPNVHDDQITLYRPDREEDIKRLISYAVGCMMGRYSLDEPGLVYAHIGNLGFDPSKYRKFPADEDGIIPLTEFQWFSDDAASRFEKFIATAWPAEKLEENLKFVAESLGPKKGETPRDTIRRYLANDFYKHHLSKPMYKKRPIYWLWVSGRQRGFQALVYLHRYHEGTLARMRTEYVIPLLGKMTARIAHLTDDIAAATSSQHKKRVETEKATITKQLAEVQAFDEKLRHFADKRIKLDLDDGVKVNYGKFGDLLAEVKAVTGDKSED